jgi:serine protease AprX
MTRSRRSIFCGTAAMCSILAGCGEDVRPQPVPVAEPSAALEALAEPGQPADKVFSAEIDARGKVRYLPAVDLPASARPLVRPDAIVSNISALTAPAEPPSEERISPALLSDVSNHEAGRAADEMVDVIVTFVQTRAMPRFPARNELEPRDSATNVAASQRAEQLVAAVRNVRQPDYDRRMPELAQLHGVREKKRFWLIDGVQAEMPLGQVRALAARKDVQYVEYAEGGEPPPHAGDFISNGRALIQSDSFFSRTGNWMGLLDVGTRRTHTLLLNPDRIGFWMDCYNGDTPGCLLGSNLSPGEPSGTSCTTHGHGTPVASILAGNTNLGNDYRGVTQNIIDSWRVYNNNCGYNEAAGVRGFEAAVAAGDYIIVAEIQSNTSPTGATSLAANAAFDAGSMVVAAAGNFGAFPNSVRSPGNAHKALAIGGIDTITQVLYPDGGRGPTSDGRIKPDLVAPTNVHTASKTSDTAVTPSFFGGTSAATPFAAGLAASVRNLMRGASPTIDPGQVYAYMIMGGDLVPFNNEVGAGLAKAVVIPSTGVLWGFVTLTPQQPVVNVPHPMGTPSSTKPFKAAIWWPVVPGANRRVELRLVKPDGTVWRSSTHATSVFQKVGNTSTTSGAGNWTLRITGVNIPASTKVYWASVRPL